MRICLISGPALATTHGTGAQLLRTFGGADADIVHLYWATRPGGRWYGRSEHPASYLLEDVEWYPLPRGGRLVRATEFRLGRRWWLRDRVNGPRVRRLLRRAGAPPQVAYVVPSDETECARCVSLLEQLRCPYVVHLMDVVHRDGLDPATMPHFRQLLRGAATVLALNGAIAHEVAKFDVRNLRVVGFSQERSDRVATPPAPGESLRVLVSGSIAAFQPGMRLLAAAWPRVAAAHAGARLVYVGGDTAALPPELRPLIETTGHVTTADYQRYVETSHLAYVGGPTDTGNLGRFSVPSRTSDYLMAGLPILAHLEPTTATAAFLAPLVPTAVHLVADADALVAAVDAVTHSRDAWQAASAAGRAFALAHLSADAVRAQVFGALTAAAASAAGPTRTR